MAEEITAEVHTPRRQQSGSFINQPASSNSQRNPVTHKSKTRRERSGNDWINNSHRNQSGSSRSLKRSRDSSSDHLEPVVQIDESDSGESESELQRTFGGYDTAYDDESQLESERTIPLSAMQVGSASVSCCCNINPCARQKRRAIVSLIRSIFNVITMKLFTDSSGIKLFSILHLLFILIIGIVLVLSRHSNVQPPKFNNFEKQYTEYFLIVCMGLGLIWMACSTYCTQPFCCCYEKLKDSAYIPGHLIFAVGIFGSGSSFLALIEFVLVITNDPECEQYKTVDACYYFCQFLFIFYQLYFFCNFSNRRFKHVGATHFFLFHILAVNICIWIRIIVQESWGNGKNNNNNNDTSCKRTMMFEFFEKSSPFLYPFVIEYSIISSGLIFNMWYQIKTPSQSATTRAVRNFDHESNKPLLERCLQNLCSDDTHGAFQWSLASFWRKSKCGFVTGLISVSVIGIIAVLEALDPKLEKVIIARIIMYILMISISWVGVHGVMFQNRSDGLEDHCLVDVALVIISMFGGFLFDGFIVAGSADIIVSNTSSFDSNSTIENEIQKSPPEFILTNAVFSFLNYMLQAIFITRAFQHEMKEMVPSSLPLKFKERRSLSANVIRQCASFLSVANMGFWILDTYENSVITITIPLEHVNSNWIIFHHICSPLRIYFRLHSAVCLYEIAVRRYSRE